MISPDSSDSNSRSAGFGPALSVLPENIPPGLRELNQWVAWHYKPRPQGKPAKPLVDARTGKAAAVDRPWTWAPFDVAVDRYLRDGLNGVGFILTDNDPYVGADIDECVDETTGEPTAEAAALVDELSTYAELSPSGRGLRAFALGRLPGPVKTKALELYDRGRYVTLTGHTLHSPPRPVAERQDVLSRLYALHAGARRGKGEPPAQDAVPAAPLALDDEALLSRARAARNGDRFAALFDSGDWSSYPSHSEGDFALCRHLIFWCGPDTARVERLFRWSALMRPKWNSRRRNTTYGLYTIAKALACQSLYYTGPRPRTPGLRPSGRYPPPVSIVGGHIKTHSVDYFRDLLRRARPLRVPGHAGAELGLLAGLCRELARGPEAPEFFLAQADAAAALGVNERTVGRHLARLCDLGVLLLLERGNNFAGRANRYRFAAVRGG
jgi:hypothetical protein